MTTDSVNGYQHKSQSAGHVPQPGQAPEKGLLDDDAIRANAEIMASHAIAQFDKATNAKLTHSHWMTLRGVIVGNMMSVIKATQEHLAGCNMVWQAMLAPDDRKPLLEAVDAEITRLSQSNDDHGEIGARIVSLGAIREKLSVGADARMPVTT